MAHADPDDSSFDPALYLSAAEQDLLVAALNSNKAAATANGMMTTSPSKSTPNKSRGDTYTSPVQRMPGSGSLQELSFENSPFLDYDLDDSNIFDWDLNGQMVGALPGQEGGSPDEEYEESGDKRKSPDDPNSDDDEEGGGKRRESEEKSGKKPGRKPLTSEPTTKRKAQNRAAQRAFRERKERHLKELETKVEDLEKAGESANHENGLLRAQVERLQGELKEYRKRLSTSGAPTRSSPTAAPLGLSSKSNWDISNNFQFAFPKFGLGNSIGPFNGNAGFAASDSFSTTSPTSQSQTSNQNSFPNTGTDNFSALFSPSVIASASVSTRRGSADRASLYRANTANRGNARLNGRTTSETNTASSASSASQNGFLSSNATTPESSAESPAQGQASEAAFNSITEGQHGRDSDSQDAFCKDFQTACGNKQNPVPPMLQDSNRSPASAATTANQPNTPGLETQGIDWFANQNGGAFEPVLFGDYRDPQDNIMNPDFGGFFNDAFPMPDFASPSRQLEPLQPQKSRDMMQQIKDTQAGKESEVVPGDKAKQFLTCNMLWDRVQRSQKVQSGEADMDELCSQLKAKAKCSGNGAVIEQNDVDAILGPAPSDTRDFFKMFK